MSFNQDPVSVTSLRWRRILPVLNLFQALPLGLRLRTLLPTLLIVVGYFVSLELAVHFELMKPPSASFNGPGLRVTEPVPESSFSLLEQMADSQPSAPSMTPALRVNDSAQALSPSPVQTIVRYVHSLLLTRTEGRWLLLPFAFALVPVLLLAAGVHRSAAVQFCRQQRVGPVAASALSLTLVPQTVVATLLAALLALLVLLPVSVTFLLFEFPLVASIVGKVWPLFLLYGVFVFISWSVLLTAWFLSLAAIAVDQCSGADALSRSISYVLTRKAQCFGYTTLIVVIAEFARAAATWFLRQGETVLGVRYHVTDETRGLETGIQAWGDLTSRLPMVVSLSVLLSGISIAYVLLRNQVDGIELRELDGGPTPLPRRSESKDGTQSDASTAAENHIAGEQS